MLTEDNVIPLEDLLELSDPSDSDGQRIHGDHKVKISTKKVKDELKKFVTKRGLRRD